MTPHAKAELRTRLRQRRASLSTSEHHAAAIAVANHVTLLPAWPDAQRIAVYLPNDGEVDTGPLNSRARDLGKQLFLPVIGDGDVLTFARWDTGTRLVENRYGIPEPPSRATRCPPRELDIIVVPLVGWDLHCNRLGMGGGFYDRTLASRQRSDRREAGDKRPVLVGVAHEVQRTERVPCERWDVAMDFIATGAALYRRREEQNAEVLLGDNNPGL